MEKQIEPQLTQNLTRRRELANVGQCILISFVTSIITTFATIFVPNSLHNEVGYYEVIITPIIGLVVSFLLLNRSLRLREAFLGWFALPFLMGVWISIVPLDNLFNCEWTKIHTVMPDIIVYTILGTISSLTAVSLRYNRTWKSWLALLSLAVFVGVAIQQSSR